MLVLGGTSRAKIPTDAAPAFIVLTAYLSIGSHGTIPVVPNMKIFAITMAGHAEPHSSPIPVVAWIFTQMKLHDL